MDKLKDVFEGFKALPWIKIGIGALIILGLGIAIDLLGIASLYGVEEAIEANIND